MTRLRVAAVVLAGGSGSRVGATTNKVLLTVGGLPLLAHAVRTVSAVPTVTTLVVVARAGEEDGVRDLVAGQVSGQAVPWQVVAGGSSRHGSEWAALQALAGPIENGEVDVVAVHDSARPLAGAELWEAVVEAAARDGGALPTRHQPGLLGPSGPVLDLVAVQTPQAFAAGPLLAAYRQADADGFEGTDTAACVSRYTDLRIRAVPAPATNLKVTFPEDVTVADRLL